MKSVVQLGVSEAGGTEGDWARAEVYIEREDPLQFQFLDLTPEEMHGLYLALRLYYSHGVWSRRTVGS